MSRWYLHVHDGTTAFPDPDGGEFPDIEAAREEALVTAREVLIDGIRIGQDRSSWRVEVASESGKPLLMVLFSEVFRQYGD